MHKKTHDTYTFRVAEDFRIFEVRLELQGICIQAGFMVLSL